MRSFLSRLLMSLIVANALSSLSFAQRTIKAGTVDVSVSIGGTFDFPGAGAYSGICATAAATNCREQLNIGNKSTFLGAAEVAVALNRFIWLYGDYSYTLPERESVSVTLNNSTDTTTTTRHYWTSTGGVEISFPTVHRIVPLLKFGGGQVYNDYNFNDVGVNVTPAFIHHFSAPNQGVWAGTFGGGMRWFPKHQERQGFRVMIEAIYLGHGIEQAGAPISGGGASFISRRSGGEVTVGYFHWFGRR